METSREERFRMAKEAREKAQKEKQYGDFGNVEIPNFKTVSLNPNKSRVIRILGEALEMHEKPTDMIQIQKSLICGDDGKYFNVIWSNDSEHPLNKLRKTILGKYKYNKETKERTYDNADLEVFKIWQTNRQFDKASQYSNGMNPNTYILMNVIDREDDWCKENNHSKLLCWSSTTQEKDGKIVEYPEYGVKPSLYNTVWDDKCTSAMLHFNETDFVVRRLSKETKIGGAKGDVYIQVCLPEEKSVIKQMEIKDKKTYLDKCSDEPLTEEELSYELYELENIPFVSKPTPVGVIMKHLEKLIKLADKTFNTNLWDEFVEWKEKELKELNESKNEEKKSAEVKEVSNETENEELPSDIEEEIIEEPKTTVTKKVAKKVVKEEFDPMTLIDDFPSIAELSDEDKNLIIGVDNDSGEIKFSVECDAQCPECGNDIPDAITSACPYCGVHFG